jgi:hypothetical protein
MCTCSSPWRTSLFISRVTYIFNFHLFRKVLQECNLQHITIVLRNTNWWNNHGASTRQNGLRSEFYLLRIRNFENCIRGYIQVFTGGKGSYTDTRAQKRFAYTRNKLWTFSFFLWPNSRYLYTYILLQNWVLLTSGLNGNNFIQNTRISAYRLKSVSLSQALTWLPTDRRESIMIPSEWKA